MSAPNPVASPVTVSPRECRVWDGGEAIPAAIPTASAPAAAGPPVTREECFVWQGGERIYLTVMSAIAVGIPLRLMLPADVRYALVECALMVVVGLTVAARPSVLVWLARGAKQAVSAAVSGAGAVVRSPARAMGGTRRVEIHTHGGHGTKSAARHEAGHRRMAMAMGWKVHSAEIFPDGSGVTRLDIPEDAPVAQLAALDVSGGIAAGTWAGCGSDLDYLRKDLATLPGGWIFDGPVRGKAKREGYALARSTVGGWFFDGGVSTDAAAIYKHGRI